MTSNFKYKNLEFFDPGFDLQSPRDNLDSQIQGKPQLTDSTPQSNAKISGLMKKAKGPGGAPYSVSLQNAAKTNTLNIPVLQQANSLNK